MTTLFMVYPPLSMTADLDPKERASANTTRRFSFKHRTNDGQIAPRRFWVDRIGRLQELLKEMNE